MKAALAEPKNGLARLIREKAVGLTATVKKLKKTKKKLGSGWYKGREFA